MMLRPLSTSFCESIRNLCGSLARPPVCVTVEHRERYALIMLNTDLHNPAIKPKMTCAQFVRSTKRTVVVEVLSDTTLANM
jgi:hypothetical protein